MLGDLLCKITNSWSIYMSGVGSLILPNVLSLCLFTLWQGYVTKDVDTLDYSRVLSTLHKLIQRTVPAQPSVNEITMIPPMSYTILCRLTRKQFEIHVILENNSFFQNISDFIHTSHLTSFTPKAWWGKKKRSSISIRQVPVGCLILSGFPVSG